MTTPARPTKRARTALSEARAWEIATLVGEMLRGRIKLAIGEHSESLNKSAFEWIEIEVPRPETLPRPHVGNALAWVAQARAACTVWFMVSCCDGFSGHENALFWKRVVDHLSLNAFQLAVNVMGVQYHDPSEEYVSDAHAFFPSADAPSAFPRFRVAIPSSPLFEGLVDEEDEEFINTYEDWVNGVASEFCGRYDSNDTGSQAHLYVSELLPLVDKQRLFGHQVEIGARLIEFLSLGDLGEIMTLFVDEMKDDEQTCMATSESLLAGKIQYPMATFKQLAIDFEEPLMNDTELYRLLSVVLQLRVIIPHVRIEVTKDISLE